MSVQAKTMYVARCDYPECDVRSSDFEGGNHTVYDSEAELTRAFDKWEGSLADDYGWLLTAEGKHYCGDHVEWNEDGDERVPMVEPITDACRGDSECPVMIHVHGCFADTGNCDDPDDHSPRA